MPVYFKRLQFIEDSTRAHKWLDMYKDSSYLKKFLSIQRGNTHKAPARNDEPLSPAPKKQEAAVLTDEKQFRRTLTQSAP